MRDSFKEPIDWIMPVLIVVMIFVLGWLVGLKSAPAIKIAKELEWETVIECRVVPVENHDD